jgi:hypothetical protein
MLPLHHPLWSTQPCMVTLNAYNDPQICKFVSNFNSPSGQGPRFWFQLYNNEQKIKCENVKGGSTRDENKKEINPTPNNISDVGILWSEFPKGWR